MCFVIAGLQPKTRTLSDVPQRCPRCGLHQAYIRQVDHYLSLFFIPLLPIKKGEPFLYCQRCEQPVAHGEQQPAAPASPGHPPSLCRQCGRSLERSFKYCPYCGQRQ